MIPYKQCKKNEPAPPTEADPNVSPQKSDNQSDNQHIDLNNDNTKTDQKSSGTKSEKIGKSREWTCMVYPESAPENWREIAQQCFLETYISPLHDKDKNPTGEPKKPHYHVVMAWAGPTTYDNAKRIMATFGGVIEPRVVGSLRGICRYLIHMDNPEKAQYLPDDIVCYNGADWATAVALKSDKYSAIAEMQDFCTKYGVKSYKQLSDYARRNRVDWWRCLCDNGTYVMYAYLKSAYWEFENEYDDDVTTLEEMIQQEETYD